MIDGSRRQFNCRSELTRTSSFIAPFAVAFGEVGDYTCVRILRRLVSVQCFQPKLTVHHTQPHHCVDEVEGYVEQYRVDAVKKSATEAVRRS